MRFLCRYVTCYTVGNLHVHRTSINVEFDKAGSDAMQSVIPGGSPSVSLAPYNWGLIFIAMLVDNFLYPISAFRSHFSQSINWSGIRYHLRNGKVFKIERRNDMVPAKTDLGGKHLYGKKGAPQKASFLSSLGRNLAHWRQPKKFDV
ncbi:hypothetical protein DY000_02012136 [Brassica cretica]|uniref:Uncharacterized protein n=1 Tax=Brassica cretica TaxID=69181 RepID=A0ABQ7CT91_BRACR|nr:hypothetical protein DY000_02012136 [Brassica cretica]